MSSGKRIIYNTAITYIRSIVGAGLALFSSRWVLAELGESDFGLYALVGSIIIFITFFNSVMSGSASRYFAYELGRGAENEVNKWFNAAFSIHLLVPLILIIIGWPIGEYCISYFFDIPNGRIAASLWVFRLSLLAAFFGMLSVPFIAMFSAKQQFVELALCGILQSILIFVAAYILKFVSGDKLIYYSVFMVAISVFIQIVQIFRAWKLFRECKINRKFWFEKSRFIQLIKFASWNVIGNAGHLIRTQGLTMLTNISFGTKGNASLGVANQLSNQTSVLANALSNAISPEIIRSEGLGNRDRAIKLAYQAAKMGTILILLLTIPILTETNNILSLWLIHVPEGAGILCRLMVVMFMLEKTTLGQYVLLQAIGKIAKEELYVGILYSLSIVCAWVFIQMGQGISAIGWACVCTMAISRFCVVYLVKKYLFIPISHWLYKIILPYILLIIVSLLFSYLIVFLFDESIYRVIINFISNFCIVSLSSYYFFLEPEEKKYLLSYIFRK